MGPFWIAELELHHIFIQAAQNAQTKHGLNDHEVTEVTKQLKRVYTTFPWKTLDTFEGVDFDDVKKCCGYLKRYATCHSALTRFATCWFLQNTPSISLNNLFCRRHCLKVVSAGGGPGNDLLGFVSAIQGYPFRAFLRLDLTVVDQKGGWEDILYDVLATAQLPNFPAISNFLQEMQVVRHFVKADLATGSIKSIEMADLILMVKVLSNVTALQKSRILENIFSSMKVGSIFLYIDIDAQRVQEKAKTTRGMEILAIKPRDVYVHSINAPLVEMIFHSTYEVCAVYKNKF